LPLPSMVLTKRVNPNGGGDHEDESSKEDALAIIPAPSWDPKLVKDWKSDVGKTLFRRIFHWGPFIALFLIFYIGFVAATLALSWWPINTIGGAIHFSIFLFWNYSTLNNFLKAAFIGGGYLTKEWIPDVDDVNHHLQYCVQCKGFKAPRSHHCSKCQRCVLKMDHHCPWINNCVGHRNHAHFVFFLASASSGCFHACIIIGASIYHGLNLVWYTRFAEKDSYPVVHLTIGWFLVSVLAVALAAGVAIAVGILLIIQLKGIYKGKTALEDYIVSKADHSREELSEEGEEATPFIFPYDMGWRMNCCEILSGMGSTRGNGVWWPVRKGTDQFTLSEEQLRQKAAKRERARLVMINEDFEGGWWRAARVGPRAFFCQPISEEERVRVQTGERWLVTRGMKHWLYGRRVGEEAEQQPKGWFPRRYGVLINDSEDETSTSKSE
ncbi:hypothetical protein PMAYCL1PPCAC_18271, partial [Pristionchus mayeri]